ncbi:hypothetical protein HDV04_005189 [Boothiomyces sp. JEL0838]|nr:hypothetical protein HDV04_005189 [Boothiomyces sp. JEL0838]
MTKEEEPENKPENVQFSIGREGMNLRSGNKRIQKFIDDYPLRAAVLALPVFVIVTAAAIIFSIVVVILVGVFVVIAIPLSLVGLPIAKLFGADIAFTTRGVFLRNGDKPRKNGIIVHEDKNFDIEDDNEKEDKFNKIDMES